MVPMNFAFGRKLTTAQTAVFASLLSWIVMADSFACQPLSKKYFEDTPERVKSNFDEAQFVVIARVIKIENVKASFNPDIDFITKVERATFRVERSFKGAMKSGQTFQIDSGFTFCARRILDPQWIAFDVIKKRPVSSQYPRRWLIYYTTPVAMPHSQAHVPPFEISSSPLTKPAAWASYDIAMMSRFADQLNTITPR